MEADSQGGEDAQLLSRRFDGCLVFSLLGGVVHLLGVGPALGDGGKDVQIMLPGGGLDLDDSGKDVQIPRVTSSGWSIRFLRLHRASWCSHRHSDRQTPNTRITSSP